MSDKERNLNDEELDNLSGGAENASNPGVPRDTGEDGVNIPSPALSQIEKIP